MPLGVSKLASGFFVFIKRIGSNLRASAKSTSESRDWPMAAFGFLACKRAVVAVRKSWALAEMVEES